jgi:hypothetical protein
MPSTRSHARHSRRAFHRDLRSIARILRLTGIAFALLGVVGLILGYEAARWSIGPSWVSLFIGALLIVAGGVRRVRDARKAPDEL